MLFQYWIYNKKEFYINDSTDALEKDGRASEEKAGKLKQVAIRAKKELENSKKQAALQHEQLNAVINELKQEAESRNNSLQQETREKIEENEVITSL